MKLKKGSILSFLDFDNVYCLLSVRNAKILVDYFKLLDFHNKNTLNDIQFCHFMHHVTDLKKKEIMHTFDMLDWDASGEIGFEQFYMLVCILLSSEFHVEKNFLFRYSRPVFEFLDMDGSRCISPAEFQSSGFLFNLKGPALSRIFHDFDVSGDEKLNYKEFKMFTMACLDMQKDAKNQRSKCSPEHKGIENMSLFYCIIEDSYRWRHKLN
ncbi:EF-hand calcium-binding domain-containing protein 9-like [Osmerus mordax]|uniref:EF-hand calcium-binding domain-containing protein 9-like n=1 Tax=Osmerus mordax TaxID=8014 RepID=UPI00350E9ECF